jgi:16S rRNA (guanine527-N7)-methyltransferase
MPLPDLVKMVRKNIRKEQQNALPNGVICLKGGDVQEELRPFKRVAMSDELSRWFDEEWFKEKHCIYVPL